MNKKKVFAVVLFLFMTLFMFTFTEDSISFEDNRKNNMDDLTPIEVIDDKPIIVPDRKEQIIYEVIFICNDGGYLEGKQAYTNILKGLTIEQAGISIPTPISNEYYRFSHWDTIPTNDFVVDENKIFKAVFKPINDGNNNDVADELENHLLTINYKYSYDLNKKVFDSYQSTLGYEAEYCINSSSINNYYPNLTKVEGIMGYEDEIYEVLYNPNNDINNNDLADEEETYIITYKLDGLYYNNQYEVYNTTFNILDKPIKEGYTISNWKLNDVEITNNVMPNYNIELNAESTINSYNLFYKIDNNIVYTDIYKYNDLITLRNDEIRQGYTFNGWVLTNTNMPSHDLIVNGSFTPNTDTQYKVNIYYQNIIDSEYTINNTLEFFGTTDTLVTYMPGIIDGFTLNQTNSLLSGNINGDGSLELDVYYERNTYNLKCVSDDLEVSNTLYKYGENIVLPVLTKEFYNLSWDKEITIMPSQNTTISAVWKKKTTSLIIEKNNDSDIIFIKDSIPDFSQYFKVYAVYYDSSREQITNYITDIDTSCLRTLQTLNIRYDGIIDHSILYSVVEGD